MKEVIAMEGKIQNGEEEGEGPFCLFHNRCCRLPPLHPGADLLVAGSPWRLFLDKGAIGIRRLGAKPRKSENREHLFAWGERSARGISH